MKTHEDQTKAKKRVTWEMDKVKIKAKMEKRGCYSKKDTKKTETDKKENPRFPILCDCLFF